MDFLFTCYCIFSYNCKLSCFALICSLQVQKSLNIIDAFSCYKQNESCSRLVWPTLYIYTRLYCFCYDETVNIKCCVSSVGYIKSRYNIARSSLVLQYFSLQKLLQLVLQYFSQQYYCYCYCNTFCQYC